MIEHGVLHAVDGGLAPSPSNEEMGMRTSSDVAQKAEPFGVSVGGGRRYDASLRSLYKLAGVHPARTLSNPP